MKVVRFKCVVCGKITAGRQTGRYSDLSERYPRRHAGPDGEYCPGNLEFAEWVEVDGSYNSITGKTKA